MLSFIYRFDCGPTFSDDLGQPLEDYIAQIHNERPGLIKKVWHKRQMGLSQSRISGWEHATADVVAILDAHIEATVGWYVYEYISGISS